MVEAWPQTPSNNCRCSGVGAMHIHVHSICSGHIFQHNATIKSLNTLSLHRVREVELQPWTTSITCTSNCGHADTRTVGRAVGLTDNTDKLHPLSDANRIVFGVRYDWLNESLAAKPAMHKNARTIANIEMTSERLENLCHMETHDGHECTSGGS